MFFIFLVLGVKPLACMALNAAFLKTRGALSCHIVWLHLYLTMLNIYITSVRQPQVKKFSSVTCYLNNTSTFLFQICFSSQRSLQSGYSGDPWLALGFGVCVHDTEL